MPDMASETKVGTPPTATTARAHATAVPYRQNIQYLRGIAALSVLLCHAGVYFQSSYKLDWYRPYFPDVIANYGVAIFFAISGYLMRELIVKQDAVVFLARRILRIYPTFVIATALAVFVIPVSDRSFNPLSLSLAPMVKVNYPLYVEWTLVHEVFFYVALFALAVVGLKRFVTPLAIAWIVAIVLNAVFNSAVPRIGHASLFQVAFMLANVGFAGGLLVPWLAKHVKAPKLMLVVFALSLAAYYVLPINYIRVIAGFGAAALVCAAVQMTITLPRIIEPAFDKLGDWSYSLYLIHVPIVTLVYRNIADSDSISLAYPLAIASAILAAACLGELDVAMHNRTKGILAKIAAKHLTVLVSAFVAIYLAIALTSL